MQQQQQQPQRRLSHHLPSRPPSAAAGTPARPRPAPSPLAPTPPKTVPAKRPLAPSQTVDRDPKRRPASDTLLKGHSDDALSSSLALLKSRPDGKPSASATLPKSLKQLLQGQPSAGRPPQISPLNQLRSSPSSSHASAMAPSPTLKVRKHDAWSHYVAEPKSLTSDPPRPQQQQQGLTRRLGSSPIVLSDDGPASPIHASALASEPPVALPSSERRPVTSVLDDGSGSAARNGPIGTNPVVVRERSRSLSPMELSDGEEVASLIEANPPPKPSAAMGSRPAEDVVSACSIKEEEEAERPKDPAATQSNPLLPLHRTPAVEQPLLPVTKDGAPAVWTDAHHILETILVSRITRSLGVLLSAWCEIRATKTPEGYGVKQLAVSLFRGFVDQSSFASVCSKDEQLVLSTVTSILLRHYLRFHRNNYTTSPPWWILDINSLPVSNFALCKSSDAEGRGLTLDTVLAEVYSNINSIRPKCSIVEDSKFEEWESAWCVLASLQCFSVADIVALGLDKPDAATCTFDTSFSPTDRALAMLDLLTNRKPPDHADLRRKCAGATDLVELLRLQALHITYFRNPYLPARARQRITRWFDGVVSGALHSSNSATAASTVKNTGGNGGIGVGLSGRPSINSTTSTAAASSSGGNEQTVAVSLDETLSSAVTLICVKPPMIVRREGPLLRKVNTILRLEKDRGPTANGFVQNGPKALSSAGPGESESRLVPVGEPPVAAMTGTSDSALAGSVGASGGQRSGAKPTTLDPPLPSPALTVAKTPLVTPPRAPPPSMPRTPAAASSSHPSMQPTTQLFATPTLSDQSPDRPPLALRRLAPKPLALPPTTPRTPDPAAAATAPLPSSRPQVPRPARSVATPALSNPPLLSSPSLVAPAPLGPNPTPSLAPVNPTPLGPNNPQTHAATVSSPPVLLPPPPPPLPPPPPPPPRLFVVQHHLRGGPFVAGAPLSAVRLTSREEPVTDPAECVGVPSASVAVSERLQWAARRGAVALRIVRFAKQLRARGAGGRSG